MQFKEKLSLTDCKDKRAFIAVHVNTKEVIEPSTPVVDTATDGFERKNSM